MKCVRARAGGLQSCGHVMWSQLGLFLEGGFWECRVLFLEPPREEHPDADPEGSPTMAVYIRAPGAQQKLKVTGHAMTGCRRTVPASISQPRGVCVL
ncbi:hypothetical protein AAFF_G00174810 [Aldrovandia affinis]|uniref:Uncharacterized protein n=1 Tax=Aldrovandia affinis TaxID=143900 RepID=A0AAD7RLL0_9TELE|nr:hypothetical protein AAFF_G00174810 [Aldrovandia affinis]